MTDLISKPYTTLHNEWVFIVSIFLLAAIAFLRVNFGRGIRLIFKAAFTQRHSNQFLRETINANISPYLVSIFVLVFTIFVSHPSWNQTNWSILVIIDYALFISLILVAKYLLIRWIGHLFQQLYLFEEVIFISFLYEQVAGHSISVLVLSIYAPFDSLKCLQIGFLLLVLFLLLKWFHFIWGFLKVPFLKHIYLYTCAVSKFCH